MLLILAVFSGGSFFLTCFHFVDTDWISAWIVKTTFGIAALFTGRSIWEDLNSVVAYN